MDRFRHMSQIFKCSTLLSKDVVRLPPCVNDFGEFLASTSDNLREAAGNSIAGYSLSSLEQYIPICLIQTVRIVATGNGLPAGFIISLNGIESLDRSGSVLYRDLKGATQFENSFWDEDIAADSFEYSASFIALMEWDMDEVSNYLNLCVVLNILINPHVHILLCGTHVLFSMFVSDFNYS